MTGVDKDLATLHVALIRAPARRGEYPLEALARVEAELSRLREERDAAEKRASDSHEVMIRVYARAEAAEAWCARLQQALAWYADYDNYDREDDDHITPADADRGEIAREALAGPDTPDYGDVP